MRHFVAFSYFKYLHHLCVRAMLSVCAVLSIVCIALCHPPPNPTHKT